MNWKPKLTSFTGILAIFVACYYLPVDTLQQSARVQNAIWESLHLVRWYAREHVLLCLVPAFFIAGAVGVFVSQGSVMKYLGASAKKVVAYGVASVSGSVLAVCSCTILPLFSGIYKMGAGLGPATTFLYSGPAINIMAIILTARVLGPELGIARAIAAIAFSIVIGLAMHVIYRKEEMDKVAAQAAMPEPEVERTLAQNTLFFAAMVGVLVFANFGRPEESTGLWHLLYSSKWILTSLFALGFGLTLVAWFKVPWWKVASAAVPVVLLALLSPSKPLIPFVAGIAGLIMILKTEEDEPGEWLDSSWTFAKQILPLLLIGVLIAGALLGRPESEGLIPSQWVSSMVGGNSLGANLFASVAGAFMYFATLTEVPILEGLIGSGMGKGPALALLLAGPALSLPNMLVIRSVMGTRKTVVFVILVIVMATVSGMIFGTFWG